MSVELLEERIGLRVPADLRAFWAEKDLYAVVPGGRASEPLTPAEILEVDLDSVPVDFLPIAGDGSGSLLCARLGPQGDVLEMVFWEHDNWADALPFGRSLAEAFLLSAALLDEGDAATAEPGVRWALAHADPELAANVRRELASGRPLAETLLARSVGLESLGEPGHEVRGSRYEIHDPRFQSYYRVTEDLEGKDYWYDLSELPAKVRAALDRDYHGLSEPDWEGMERASSRLIARRDDIGWAWILRADLAGRRGDEAAARLAIGRAARCLERTFDRHDRDLLRGVRGLADVTDPVTSAFMADDAKAMAAHWAEVAKRAEASDDPGAAWGAWYRHVHHVRQPKLHDVDVLDAYARIADLGGFTCWSKLVAAKMKTP